MSPRAPLAVLILAAVAIASTQAALTIPEVLKSSARYFVINDRTGTFWQAFRYCNSLGLQLASVNSANDNKALTAAIAAAPPPKTKGAWWIAGTDLGKEGDFVWITTQSRMGFRTGYTNWAAGEPNNEFGNEHCVEVYSYGEWNDKNCDVLRNYICEKPW
ncbi:pulmonary surfactant-associated protein D-like [Culex pipiens pallens]|uniref:pulmonary surfactant-associated protein D-like n=1 Tax=Culex pipiens pallens TaxID=42434 RepID=UPI001952E23E|nr:pulmonary surfactant-associated protein D-like [Culex pipiens pallens]